ncbi:MAG TPA: lysylphosphatidylglycerol synthase transmembrane domain-containing protein [Anaerolineales bacterium]|nr:lysylphosphatidylglycerol synthase transmembrane domain-containing protein [Anaerolineales bacterium]
MSLAALVLVFTLIDLRKLGEAIRQADVRFLLLGILSEVLWLLVRGFVWRTLLQNKATYRQSFITINEGYLLNNILPFRLGEIGRAFLIGRKAHLDFWQVIPSILIERALDLAIAVGIFMSTLPFVIGVSWARQAALVIGSVVVIGLGALYVVARNRGRVLGWIDRAGERWSMVKKLSGRRVAAFFDGLGIITDGRLFLSALGWEGFNWLLAILQYYLFLRAFFPAPSLLWVLFALGVGALGIAAPSSPGAIGVFEAVLVGALVVFGLDASPATAFALSVHFTSYIVTALIGGYGLYKDGESLSGLYTRLGKMKTEGETHDPAG